MHSLFL